MIQIAPSILSADFTKLGADLDAIATADMVHFDVMDGAFVPNISYGMPICKAVNQYTDMFLDTHLMIEKPARYIEDFAKAGADLISVHLEADGPRGIEDALNATKAAVEEGIVAGGGTAQVNAIPAVEELIATLHGDEKTGARIIAAALQAPIRQIAENAGVDGSVVYEKIRTSGKVGYGYNAYTEEYVDMIPAGIVDPTKVTRSALENAASVAEMVLTTESLVADLPEPPAAPAAAFRLL